MPAACPYCARSLAKVPKRRIACPSCGEPILVRKGVLVTDESAAKIDGMENLERLGVTSAMFDDVESELATRFGHRPTVRDVFWGILNRLVVSKSDHADLCDVYREMADQVRREGKDPSPFLRQALELELRAIAEDRSVKRVTIMGVGDDRQCPGCASLDGMEFKSEEALRDMPIPTQCTSEEGCRCSYMSLFDGVEANDQLLIDAGILNPDGSERDD